MRFVTYSNTAKEAMLGVPAATLKRHGAVKRAGRGGMAAGRAQSIRRPTCRWRSPASPVRAAARRRSLSVSVHFAAASRSGRLLARSRRYGKIGAARVRERSVAEALELLATLAREADG